MITFHNWLESTYAIRSLLVAAIDAVIKRDLQSIGVLGDQLQDHNESLGEVMVRLFNGEHPFVRIPNDVIHGEDYVEVNIKVAENKDAFVISYGLNNNGYVATIELETTDGNFMHLQFAYPKSNVVSGSDAMIRRKQLNIKGDFARTMPVSILPKVFPVAPPSEDVLRKILQTLLAKHSRL